MMVNIKKLSALVGAICFIGLTGFSQAPLADGQTKFLGCAHSSTQNLNFATYWNQVTPENGGKWGSVEGARNVMNWGAMDAAYNLAKNKGYLFKNHTMIWGSQQPSWIESLDTATQRLEIEQWFALTAARYPNMDLIDVVNEPLHAPPSGTGHGNYINALGGSGTTGWDWIIKSFRMARKYFPNSKLLINEYSIVNSTATTQQYINIINLLKTDTLIDGIGIQCHAFSTYGVSSALIKSNLDLLAATGLPIYVSEMDIDGTNDLAQLREYERVFPLFWEHPGVAGITLWGFRYGLWRTDQGAYLVNSNGTERLAFDWLKAYVNDTLTSPESVAVTSVEDTVFVGETLQMVATVSPSNATIKNVTWSSGSINIATVNSTTGLMTSLAPGKVTIKATTYDAGKMGSKVITIVNRLVDSISVTSTGNVDTIKVGETMQMLATVIPANATNIAVRWSVLPSGLATISTQGLISSTAVGTISVIAVAKDGSGVSDTMQIIIKSLPSSNTGNLNDENIAVFPNPSAGGRFSIQGTENITAIAVLDLYGRVVDEYTPLHEPIVNIKINSQPGVYIIRLSNGKQITIRRVLVK
jgi:endo-1,4-beta-xylanase